MFARYANLLFAAAMASVPGAMLAQAPVGELYSTVARVRGSVTLISGGTDVMSGSSIESGEQPASLVLTRGGAVTICQGTNVSVSSSADGQNLMFSFGTGTLESRYSMKASSDVIVTPDLRLVITGPGEFDLDVGITPQGDTCVRSHRESTGGVIINEQMGDGSYQVKPSDFVVFRKGRVANAETNPQGISCSCPAPKAPVRETYVAETPKTATQAPATPKAPSTSSEAAEAHKPSAPSSLNQPLYANGDHMQVEAPFVFSADSMLPALTMRIMHLHMEANPAADLKPEVQPPARVAKKKGFWHRLGQWFS